MNFFDYNLYEKLPKYPGKDEFYVFSKSHRVFSIIAYILIGFLFLAFATITLFAVDLSVTAYFLNFALPLLITAFFFFLIAVSYRKIVINKSGVSLKTSHGKTIKHFEWDNIEHIHVLLPLNNVTPPYKFYISTDPLPMFSLGRNTLSNTEYMVIFYSPEIIHCILQFWDKKIGNYDEPKSWKNYVDKL